MQGDPFFCYAKLRTDQSPYVKQKAIEQAKRLLPKYLYDQYYEASFVSHGTVFGDLSGMWDESLVVPTGVVKFWRHPNEALRQGDIIHGVDPAQRQDYTVFYTVNAQGQLVGYCRFKHVPYTMQVLRLQKYIETYFNKADNMIRYDATGVGVPFGDLLVESDIDAAVTPVVFTNKSKNEMVTRTTLAIEAGWHKAPRIEAIDHEFSSYELTVTKTGLHRYAASEGTHDDIVSAAILAISYGYQSHQSEEAEKLLEECINGKMPNKDNDDHIAAYAAVATGDKDDSFFDDEGGSQDDDFDFDMDNA
jgi:hypothetical protein